MSRFFVDETDLALGKALADVHSDVVFPGHPDLPEIGRGALDDEWLPIVGRRGLVVITRDKQIRYRAAEKQAWVNHRVRGFVLTGRRSQSTADSLAVVLSNWTRIEHTIAEGGNGPWMYAVTEGVLRWIPLH